MLLSQNIAYLNIGSIRILKNIGRMLRKTINLKTTEH